MINKLGCGESKFDKHFIRFFHFQNFNHGMFAVMILAFQDLGKNYLGVDPGEIQIYKSIIMMPWSFKLLYGLLSDNQSTLKIGRRGWMIAMGSIQFISLFTMFAFKI